MLSTTVATLRGSFSLFFAIFGEVRAAAFDAARGEFAMYGRVSEFLAGVTLGWAGGFVGFDADGDIK